LVIFSLFILEGCLIGIDYSAAGKHQSFKNMYGRQLGLDSTNADLSWIARYPESVINREILSNGNIELEYRAMSFRDGCRVFYEIDSVSKIVTTWRFEGDEHSCWWVGP